MKKITFTLTLLIIVIASEAQIKVNPNNTVKIGDIYNTQGQTHPLQVTGEAWFQMAPANSGFYLEEYLGQPCIRPQWGNTLFLGRHNHNIWRTYSYNIHYKNLYQLSDQRYKTNIEQLNLGLNEVLLLNPVSYDTELGINDSTPESRKLQLQQENQGEIGLLAQEVQQIFPDLVFYDEENDLYSLDYTRLIPILIKAIQEQNSRIDELESHLND